MAFKDLLNKGKEMAVKGATSLKETASETKEKLAQQFADDKASRAPLDGAIIRYGVTYLGGLPKYPKKLTGELGMNIMPDCFHFHPSSTLKMEEDTIIPYSCVEKLEITRHQITNAEMMIASGTDMKSMEQENNIEISYRVDGKLLVLRVEMLTGVSLYGQAGKCREMMDVLRQNEILDKFAGEKKAAPDAPAISVADELKKFKELLDMGVISNEDFEEKKKQLLGL